MTEAREVKGFETEVSKLLHLMIHSLYSNREIFLRELISNASDACDKLRFEALDNPQLLESDSELVIHVRVDKDKRLIEIEDNGVGMTRDEAVANLGTIAKSGTQAFMDAMSGDQKKDARLIGQFGVGFYSAFIVADKVEVFSRKAGEPAETGVHWESEGQGEFAVETVEKPGRGTRIVLHLRDDAKEFADDWKIRSLVRQYSDHVAFPIRMAVPVKADAEDVSDQPTATEEETINSADALWLRARNEVKEEEYQAFYKHLSHDFEDPLAWSHNKVEGKLEYTSLLYVPARAPFDLYNRDVNRGLKLYVQRVFIMDQADQFLPMYLRFIRGVVDSSDLPLNVSRELLQDHGAVRKIGAALVKRALDMLKKLARDEEKYAAFWKEFGAVLKEGVVEDPANQEAIAALLRFNSLQHPEAPEVSLDAYIDKAGDAAPIYYLVGESLAAVKQSPHLEMFRKKGIDVLLLGDRIDEWVVGHLLEYKGHKLVNAARGELELDDQHEEKAASEEEQDSPLLTRMKAVLADQVDTVRHTRRLVESPACLVLGEHQLSAQMKQIFAAAGQSIPDDKPILEINPEHALIQALDTIKDEAHFEQLSLMLLDQATLAEGQLPKDPAAAARRLNDAMVAWSASQT